MRTFCALFLPTPRCKLEQCYVRCLNPHDEGEDAVVEFLTEIVRHPNFSLTRFDFGEESLPHWIRLKLNRMMDKRHDNALLMEMSLFNMCAEQLKNVSIQKLPIPLIVQIVEDRVDATELTPPEALSADIISLLTGVLKAINNK